MDALISSQGFISWRQQGFTEFDLKAASSIKRRTEGDEQTIYAGQVVGD